MSTIKVDKLQGTSGSATALTLNGAASTFNGVHTVGNNAIYTSDGGAVTQNLVQGLIKMWYDLDGIGTLEIGDSFNVASVSDGGTGAHTSNFTNNTASARYSMNMGGQSQTDVGFTARDASSVTLLCRGGSGSSAVDIDGLFGNLAGDLA